MMKVTYSDFVNKFLWRNNVIKGYLVFSIVMSLSMYGVLIFIFNYMEADQTKIWPFVMPFQLLFGSFSQFYNHYFSHISAILLPLHLQKVDLSRVLTLVFKRIWIFQAIIFFGPALFFYDKSNLLIKLIEMAIFNMGVVSFMMLSISVSTDSFMAIHYNKVRKAKNKHNFSLISLFVFPMVFGLLWIDDFLLKEFGAFVGHGIVLSVETALLLAYPIFLAKVNSRFMSLRYRKLRLYFSFA
ncbi:hypothetical protein CLV98_12128 [Dyadobacter jejuensis]|uniref:Uncharacterized protein n=1 Tax=Dyadobacter jejuensis TaxID=1082580 RepID=A0A316A741_9BACT|nr:hypothetical protein [Dyadobacter jejuensis]PWJ53756.1 hypothetical protein CLV98_12128 [Dyadobacter jejuensis]